MGEKEEPAAAAAAAPPPPSCSRWNPTKEQITLLEGLYRQGVRTPTAEQIQHIAGKLQEYGRIEGKNVFYWFQNHKARQRQKQKQETSGQCKLLRPRAAPPPLRPAVPHPGVIRRPCYVQQFAAVGYYPPPPAVIFAGSGTDERRRRGLELYDRRWLQEIAAGEECTPDAECQRTLQLFPLHPAAASEEKPVDSLSTTPESDGGSCPSPLHLFGSGSLKS